ncbi:MAG: CRISPR-associated endonuclease Cas1 [Proteobacteria bacterium]|nr:CRISPR-associated endonuclease Cas1 [Pseudomonadota bacterium]
MEQEALLPAPSEARIVEIGEAGRSISFAHGNIAIAGDEGVIERIPILEIAGMVVWCPGLSWSGSALAALSERGAGIVVCEPNYRSRMLSWPMSGRRWPGRIRAQMEMDGPFARHLLRGLAKARDDQRDAVLGAMGRGNALKALRKASKPTIGSSQMSRDRKQADVAKQIDRHYWPWLAGPGFRRDLLKEDGNAVINFAHTMLRVEATRAVHKAALHPSIGLGSGRGKGGLIDDLMLPYRPVVDLAAALLIATGQRKLDEAARAMIVRLFTAPMRGRRGLMQIRMGLEELALSLANCIESGKPMLEIRLPAIKDPSAIYDQMTDVRGQESERDDQVSGWG